MDTMIEIPALRRMAELAPNSADTDTRTVEVIWSAGARVRRSTLFGEPYDEELSLDPDHVRLDRLNAGAPFLKVHEVDTLDAVIGSVVPGSARIENGRGIAQVRISERADVEPIWRDIQAGPHPGGLHRLPGSPLRGLQTRSGPRALARGGLDAL